MASKSSPTTVLLSAGNPTWTWYANTKQTILLLQSSQADKTVKCEILFFTSYSLLPRPSRPFYFSFPFSFFRSPFLSHLLSFSLLRHEVAPQILREDFGEYCKLLQWNLGQQSSVANTFLRHCELGKCISWQQFWVTFFCRRSKNLKCRYYWQTSGNWEHNTVLVQNEPPAIA